MTEEEIDELLQDAIEIVFRVDMSIVLIFPNKHESENSYNAVTEFFEQSELILRVKKSTEFLEIFLTNKTGQFVHTKDVFYDEANFNNWFLNGDRQYKISLFMIHNIYRTKNFEGFPNTKAIIKQQNNKLNIISFEIIDSTKVS